MNLRDLLTDDGAGDPEVQGIAGSNGSVSWTAAGQVYAVLSADGSAADFLLDPAVAAAAVRTPGASPSSRGPGWVSFRPPALDDHAVDRAVAWLASAQRRLLPG